MTATKPTEPTEPTAKQLALLATLARERGVPAPQPATRTEASRAIRALIRTQPVVRPAEPAKLLPKRAALLRDLHREMRELATARGDTFAYPTTIAEAIAEASGSAVGRAPPASSASSTADGVHAARAPIAPATRIRDDEIEGYGSNCRWSHLVHDE